MAKYIVEHVCPDPRLWTDVAARAPPTRFTKVTHMPAFRKVLIVVTFVIVGFTKGSVALGVFVRPLGNLFQAPYLIYLIGKNGNAPCKLRLGVHA